MRRAAFVLLAALVLVASPLAQAALTANVDARTISESDTLELYVRAADGRPVESFTAQASSLGRNSQHLGSA